VGIYRGNLSEWFQINTGSAIKTANIEKLNPPKTPTANENQNTSF